MIAAGIQTQWARLLIESMARAGAVHAVLSPGSRSTPLAWAALNCPSLRKHVVVDERSAGFFALGLSKATRVPTLLICTSGSAVSHYLPAAIEASHSETPLIILSADRPFELQNCAAPQTIDQLEILGGFTRHNVSLGVPEARQDSFRALWRTARQAVWEACGSSPGPVHINVPLRKPLEPAECEGSDDAALAHLVDTLLSETSDVAGIVTISTTQCYDETVASVRKATSGFVALGPSSCRNPQDCEHAIALAAATGFPLLCEAASGARYISRVEQSGAACDAVGYVLESPAPPDGLHVVLQVGAPLVCGAYQSWLEKVEQLHLHVLGGRGWADPSSRAKQLFRGEPIAAIRPLISALEGTPFPNRAALAKWREQSANRNTQWWLATTGELESAALTGHLIGEPHAIRETIANLPADSVLVLGNSLPVREIDWFSRMSGRGTRVYTQRGANGIDGALSSAGGIAEGLGTATTALIGDLSFLHDLGGLWAISKIRVPLAIVVLNNSGGRIFDQLPIAQSPRAREYIDVGWVVPHELNLGAAAEAFGLPYLRVETVDQIGPSLRAAHCAQRATIVEVVVAPTSTLSTLQAIRARLVNEAVL